MIKLIVFIMLISTNSFSQTPTIVFGSSELPNHKPDSVLLIQPKGSPNPLGDPIITMPQNNVQENQNVNQSQNAEHTENIGVNMVNQVSEQNPLPFSLTPEQLKNKIENTLYQGGDRIYDIQSFPLKDINKITEPNIQPTITDYPAY